MSKNIRKIRHKRSRDLYDVPLTLKRLRPGLLLLGIISRTQAMYKVIEIYENPPNTIRVEVVAHSPNVYILNGAKLSITFDNFSDFRTPSKYLVLSEKTAELYKKTWGLETSFSYGPPFVPERCILPTD